MGSTHVTCASSACKPQAKESRTRITGRVVKIGGHLTSGRSAANARDEYQNAMIMRGAFVGCNGVLASRRSMLKDISLTRLLGFEVGESSHHAGKERAETEGVDLVHRLLKRKLSIVQRSALREYVARRTGALRSELRDDGGRRATPATRVAKRGSRSRKCAKAPRNFSRPRVVLRSFRYLSRRSCTTNARTSSTA